MNKNLKELIIYILLLLAVPTILIAIPVFIEEREVPHILYDADPIIFIMAIALLVLVSPILITILAIKKAKGKYLRTFFDNLKYSTIGIIFILLALISKHFFEFGALYVIPFCFSIIFTIIFGLINKKTKDTLAFLVYLVCSIVLLPLILNYDKDIYRTEAFDYIKDFIYSLGYIYISVYLAILIYNGIKFIKSKHKNNCN